MKKISAKMKLTLWTVLLMLLMAGVLMGVMFSLSDRIISSNSITQLKEVVADNADELEFDDGRLEFDDVNFFVSSVYTLLYTQEGELLAGSFPEEIVHEQPFQDGEVVELTVDGTLYYVFDTRTMPEGGRSPVWVRGVIAVDEVASATNNLLQMTCFVLPVFIVLAAFGSYWIAKNTFRPIDKIVKIAQQISDSGNLSLRIALEGESREIQQLARTFDTMFARLEATFEAEKQFTSDVSHELRTPTAVILAQCEYATSKTATVEDKEEALETVQRQAAKMSAIISSLLNFMRLDRGIEKARFENLDVSELVEQVCLECALIAPCDVKFTYSIQPHISGRFDEEMLTRLLTNLISNAFRYRKEGGKATVVLCENDGEIILSVEDDGIGISEEQKAKIWQRFYQVDSSRTASQDGTMGLGLSMVEQITKLHHAKIELQSELDKGSLFVIKFPQIESHSNGECSNGN